ncbi:MAG: PHP domain-containing protein, partial [Chlamydiales bacterium]|nr:PHP domain-containing protein [Chlamydiales bacterium]
MIWTPLNVHSQFSILDSTASVAALVDKAKSYGMSALGLTDMGNLYGAIDFYKACKAAKIKPILGCEIWIAPSSRHEKKRIPGQPNGFPLILLAKNNQGYQHLCKLSSIGFLEGFYYQPRIDKETLSLYREGLICLSGPMQGHIPYLILQDLEEQLLKEVTWYQQLFGEDFYFELQRHQMTEEQILADGMEKEQWLFQKYQDYSIAQKKVNQRLLSLASEFGISYVATNDIHYLERDDWRAHEILLNVQSGEPCEIWERDSRGVPKNKAPNPKRETVASHELYFKSPEQMQALFADIPLALEETQHIVAKCHVELDFTMKHYPVFIAPALEGKSYTVDERLRAAEQFLYDLGQAGIKT